MSSDRQRTASRMALWGVLSALMCACAGSIFEEAGVELGDAEDELANSVRLFAGVTPQAANVADAAAVELGLKFRSSVDGRVLGVRFYKSRENTGAHTGSLWTSQGALLATLSFSRETTSGWQRATFAAPVAIRANEVYVVSYHTSTGHYSGDNDAFAAQGRDVGPLHALSNAEAGGNGVFRYGASAFPNETYRATNYFVDVVFAPDVVVADAGVAPPVAADAGIPTKPVDAGTPPKQVDAGAPSVLDAGMVPKPVDAGTPAVADAGAPPKPLDAGTPPTIGGCPPLPAFPDENCTGWKHTGVTLTPYTGPTIITVAGTVIDAKDINDCLEIRASNVTIKRSRISCSTSAGGITYGTPSVHPTGLLIEDTEVTSTYQGADCTTRGLSVPLINHAIITYEGNGGVLRRLYVHQTRTGIKLGNNMTLEDSYLPGNCNPDEDTNPATDWQHSTAAANGGGSENIVLRHNYLHTAPNANASSAISFYTDYGPSRNLLMDGNLLDGSGGYCAYLFGHANLQFINNRFGTRESIDCGDYGPVHSWTRGNGNVWSNNTWHDLRPTTSSYTNKHGKLLPEP